MRIDTMNKANAPVNNIKSNKSVFKDEKNIFEKRLKDRIENGQPKYNMGMSSMTEDDWESFMSNIDKSLENAKTIQLEKKGESLESQIYDKIYFRLHEDDKN